MKKILLICTLLVSCTIFGISQNKKNTSKYTNLNNKKIRELKETIESLNEFEKNVNEREKAYLAKVKNSRYSTLVEKKVTEWKKKSEFEKTIDWQKRLSDSTEIKRVEFQENSVDELDIPVILTPHSGDIDPS